MEWILQLKRKTKKPKPARVPLLFITKSTKILQSVQEGRLQFHKTNMPDISLYSSELLWKMNFITVFFKDFPVIFVLDDDLQALIFLAI